MSDLPIETITPVNITDPAAPALVSGTQRSDVGAILQGLNEPHNTGLAAAALSAKPRITVTTSRTHVTFATEVGTVSIPKVGFWATFWKDFVGFFKKLFQDGPTWAQLATSVLQLMGPAVVVIAGLWGGPAVGTAASQIVSAVQVDMATLSAVLKDANTASGVTVSSVIASLQTNLASLLAAVRIEDPGSVAEAEQLVKLLLTDINAMANSLPKNLGAPAAA